MAVRVRVQVRVRIRVRVTCQRATREAAARLQESYSRYITGGGHNKKEVKLV